MFQRCLRVLGRPSMLLVSLKSSQEVQVRKLLLWMTIVPACAPLLLAQNPATAVNVDANASRHAINPQVYGVAFASQADLSALNVPLNRSGGNSTSTYNWQTDAHNTAQDYYWESISECFGAGGNPPCMTPGGGPDAFITATKAANAEPLITIPMLDWIAKRGDDHPFFCSFPKTIYPNQDSFDQFDTNCGNGQNGGVLIAGSDPNNAYVPSDVNTQQGWVQHLINTWGAAAKGGVKYYILDNEHSIWFSTHFDVHPQGPGMDEIAGKMISYGGMVRTNDANAVIFGPEEYGWTGYFYSGKDQQYFETTGDFNPADFPDRSTHGGMDYMPWLLGALHTDEVNTGVRKLDVFSLHYYPQENEYSNAVDTATQLLRNRSTRSLWDPTYKDTSYINDYVMLVPRMKSWVAANYPGLKTAITEYNWGAEDHINGATTQADIYGIFGREGLDMATRWTTPANTTPTFKSMQMYRNYDGNQSTFGDTSVQATFADPDSLTAYAALRSSDNALTVMVINKVLSGNTPVTVSLANFNPGGPAQVWQLNSANTISQLANLNVNGNAIALSAPPQSITLLVIPQAPAQPPPDFQLGVANPASVNVVAGNASQPITLQLTANSSFNATVHLACSTATGASCAFMPASSATLDVAPRANAPANVILLLSTTGATTTGTVTVNATSNQGTSPQSTDIALNIVAGAGSADLSASVANDAATPPQVQVGKSVGFVVTVSNAGPNDVNSSTLMISFNPPLLGVGGPAGCIGSEPVVCTLGPILNGLNTTVRVTGIAPVAHDLIVSATVSSGASDPNPANNTASQTEQVRLLPRSRN